METLTLTERVAIIEERLGIDHAAIAADAAESHARGVEQNAEPELEGAADPDAWKWERGSEPTA